MIPLTKLQREIMTEFYNIKPTKATTKNKPTIEIILPFSEPNLYTNGKKECVLR